MEPQPIPISTEPIAVPIGEGDEQTQITLEVGGTVKKVTMGGESSWEVVGFMGSVVLLKGVEGLMVDGRDNLVRVTPHNTDAVNLQTAAMSYVPKPAETRTETIEA